MLPKQKNMKPLSISFLSICLSFAAVANAGSSEKDARKRYMVFGSNPNVISDHMKKKGRKAFRRARNFPAVLVDLNSSEIAELQSQVSGTTLVEDSSVQAAYDKYSLRIEGAAFIKKSRQKPDWGYKFIRAGMATRIAKGQDVRVCIVDTGIDPTHPDLIENVAGGRNFTSNDPNAWYDDHGHGTHVAGTVAAVSNTVGVVGVAPKAKIYAMKVLDGFGSGSVFSVADGVLECIKIGANVINMSLGGPKGGDGAYDPMALAVQAAIDAGIEVVVAAGNNVGQDIANYVPASYPGVIAVGAVQRIGVNKVGLAYFSNIGLGAKDYVAPGWNIRSTWPGGNYSLLSGTSMAAPHVTGVIALKLNVNAPSLKAKSLNLPMSKQGSGLVDALATVKK